MQSEIDGTYDRLLALDDEPASAVLIARLARQCGYDARAMVETRMLVDVLQKWQPDVVTLDLCMPRVSGSDVISLLKIMNFPGQIIIVSGLKQVFLDQAGAAAKFGRLKLAATLRKPIDIVNLRQLLNGLRRNPGAEASELAS